MKHSAVKQEYQVANITTNKTVFSPYMVLHAVATYYVRRWCSTNSSNTTKQF